MYTVISFITDWVESEFSLVQNKCRPGAPPGQPSLFLHLADDCQSPSQLPEPPAYTIFLFYSQCFCIQDLSQSLVQSQVHKIKFPFDLHFSLPMTILSQRATPRLPNGLLRGHSSPGCGWRLPRPYGSVPLAPMKWAGVLSFLVPPASCFG